MSLTDTSVDFAFALLGLCCVALNLVLLPGNWLLLLLAIVIELSDGGWRQSGAPDSFHLWVLIAAGVLAVTGEITDVASGAIGAKAFGSSRRGVWGALIGGFAGSIIGTVLIPIPVAGTVAGAIGGCALGALIGEIARPGVSTKDAMRAAFGALVGRVVGVIVKCGLGLLAWAGLVVSCIMH